MRGKFIVVEGLDGSGKGTQTALLCAYLKSQGRNVYPTAEPTESVTGGMIRDVLSGARQRTSSELAALFLADRVAHNMNPVNGIEKTLEAGIDVVCDRYYYSSIAYQAVGEGQAVGHRYEPQLPGHTQAGYLHLLRCRPGELPREDRKRARVS